MTANTKLDSNSSGLAIARETSPGILPVTPLWYPQEPNTYKDFGGKYKLVARQTINASRQRQKGVVVDLDALANYQFDLTQRALEQLAEGVFFAAYRAKNDLAVATTTSGHFTPASGGDSFKAGDIVFGKDFASAANNAKFLLAADGTGTSVAATGVVAETGSNGKISRVGHRFGVGLASVSTSGSLFGLNTDGSTGLDLTTLGLIPGEWVFIGGDATGTFFSEAASNGWGRIKTIAAHRIDFDKWEKVSPVDDTGTSLTIEIYFGRVLKNESDPSIIEHYTFQLERQLPPADTSASYQQAEYVIGGVLDELDVTFNTADKITCDLAVVAQSYATVDDTIGPKSGTRESLVTGDAYNTSSDVRRSRVALVGNSNALFGFFTSGAIQIKNNTKPNKAVGTLGSFAQTAGIFEISASITAYFVDVASLAAIKNASDVTLDYIIAKNNAGLLWDIPLIALGGGLLDIKLNEPVMMPLTMDAATARKYNLDYTIMMIQFDYLPTLAMPGN